MYCTQFIINDRPEIVFLHAPKHLDQYLCVKINQKDKTNYRLIGMYARGYFKSVKHNV